MNYTDLQYCQSVIAKLAPMEILDMEKIEGIQKKAKSYRDYPMWELRPPQLLFSEPGGKWAMDAH